MNDTLVLILLRVFDFQVAEVIGDKVAIEASNIMQTSGKQGDPLSRP